MCCSHVEGGSFQSSALFVVGFASTAANFSLSLNWKPTFATAQRTAMDLSVSRERAFL